MHTPALLEYFKTILALSSVFRTMGAIAYKMYVGLHFPGTKGNGGGGGQITNFVIDLNNPINLNSNRRPGGIANAALIPGESLRSSFVHFYTYFLRNT